MTGKISLALNILLAIAVIYLFTQINKPPAEPEEVVTEEEPVSSEEKVYPSIAWVNNDSLQLKYDFINDKTKDLEKIGASIKSLEGQAQNTQTRYMALAEKLQRQQYEGGQYDSQEAMDKDVNEIAKIEESSPGIQSRLQNKYTQLQKKQAEINDSLISRVNRFIESYSNDKPIDLILLYSQGITGLYATDALDLTDEVIEGLNAAYATEKTSITPE